MALKITPGNTADSTVLDEITQHLTGKLYADKGYISREVFSKLWQRGLHLITGIRRNMQNHLMPLADKLMLRKRFVIETVLDILKSDPTFPPDGKITSSDKAIAASLRFRHHRFG
jgi:hypothetical protein